LTTRVFPTFLSVDDWRAVVKNNADIGRIHFDLRSARTWIPHILVDAGFFKSGSQIRKNRPDLMRDREEYDVVDLDWAEIEVWPA
jgi:hypothetical protein